MEIPKIFILHGEITWESVGAAIERIYEAYYGEDQARRFIIPIMSPGGDVDASWSLYSVLKNLDAEISTLASGRVFSSAVIPFLAGQKRYSYEESVFLFHPATVVHAHNEEQPFYKIAETLDGERYDRLLFRSILGKLCNKKEVEDLVHESKSFFIDAKKAKKLGLVTQIINNLEQIKF